jgi:hypothetical protein
VDADHTADSWQGSDPHIFDVLPRHQAAAHRPQTSSGQLEYRLGIPQSETLDDDHGTETCENEESTEDVIVHGDHDADQGKCCRDNTRELQMFAAHVDGDRFHLRSAS